MRRTRIVGAGVLLCTCFGTGLVAIRVGVSYLPPITFTMVRLGVIVVAFVLLLAVTRRAVDWTGRLVRNVALVGVLNVGLPYMLSAQALRLVSSTLLSILMNLIPVFSVILAHFFLADERLTPRTGLGVGAAVGGASLVVWGGAGAVGAAESLRALWLGTLLIVANALSVATSNVLLRRRLAGDDALVVTGGQMTVGLLTVTPFALALEGMPRLTGLSWQGWVALLWSALVGAFLGYSVSFLMLRRWGVTTTAVASTGTPLVTAIAGALLLGERLTPLMALGGLVLIGGVLMVLSGARKGNRTGSTIVAAVSADR
jgi:drug/metabolite transporter (DMT)-like permease